MVQLPDGTMERRLKMPLNVDPGVHSSFHLDQLVPGTPITPVPTLQTITEAKTIESFSQSGGSSTGDKKENNPTEDSPPSATNPLPTIPEPIPESPEERESPDGEVGSVVESRRGSGKGSAGDLPISTSIPIPRRGPRRNSEGVVSSSSPSSNQGTPSSSFKVIIIYLSLLSSFQFLTKYVYYFRRERHSPIVRQVNQFQLRERVLLLQEVEEICQEMVRLVK